jgi:hypothetical protein
MSRAARRILRPSAAVLHSPIWRAGTEDIMRSTLVKLALGCALAAAFAAPTLACDFNKITAESNQPVAQSQQTTPDPNQTATPDTPQTAESQPAPNASSN